MARSECSGCGKVFSSVGAFELHRVGTFTDRRNPRRCLSPQEMQKRGMQRNAQGQWTGPVSTTAAPWYENDGKKEKARASRKGVNDGAL